MGGEEAEGTAGHPESVRPPSAEELESKWRDASWYRLSPYKDLNLRLRRATSWLGRAEREVEDHDAAFIFLWIAFNAIYGQSPSSRASARSGHSLMMARIRLLVGGQEKYERGSQERPEREMYLMTIYRLESNRVTAVMQTLSAHVEELLANQYVFEPFWKHLSHWKQLFRNAKKKRESRGANKKTEITLTQLFERLYVLRNQLLHGSATWNGSVNRSQVTPGAKIMATLVPHFIDVMIRHPNGWGAPRYPVVRETGPQSGWTGSAGSE